MGHSNCGTISSAGLFLAQGSQLTRVQQMNFGRQIRHVESPVQYLIFRESRRGACVSLVWTVTYSFFDCHLECLCVSPDQTIKWMVHSV